MKRLLVFFFVFFSLALTLNVNANSNDKIFCIIKTSNSDNFVFIQIDESEIYKLKNSKYNWKSILKNTSIKHPLTTQEKKELKFCNLKVYKSKNYTAYFDLKKQWEALGGFSGSSLIHHKPLAYLHLDVCLFLIF